MARQTRDNVVDEWGSRRDVDDAEMFDVALAGWRLLCWTEPARSNDRHGGVEA